MGAIVAFYQSKKVRPPIFTEDMLEPVDAPVSISDAKRIFKQWMLGVGHLSDDDVIDRMELSGAVRDLVDSMREHEASLKDDFDCERDSWQDAVAEHKGELRRLQRELARCTEPAERSDLQEEISYEEHELRFASELIDDARQALASFRSSKRDFLVDYINTQVHGADWRKLTGST